MSDYLETAAQLEHCADLNGVLPCSFKDLLIGDCCLTQALMRQEIILKKMKVKKKRHYALFLQSSTKGTPCSWTEIEMHVRKQTLPEAFQNVALSK